jgi:hypothetical protein
MEQEFRINLNILTDYLKNFDCIAEFSLDDSLNIEYGGTNSVRFHCQGKNSTHPLPIPMERMIEKYLDEEVDERTSINDEDFYQYQLEIDPFERTLTVIGFYSLYVLNDTETRSVNAENEEDLHEIFDYLESYMTEKGFTNVGNNELIVEFNGGGDSGLIEETGYFTTGESLEINDLISDFTYAMLEMEFSGWEINEGSEGSFKFNTYDRECTLYFKYRNEEQGNETVLRKNY